MTRVWLAVIAVLIAALLAERVRGNRAQASAVRLALARDSVEAGRDSTREVAAGAVRDSVRVFVRRAQQQEQRADGLDRSIKARRLARVNAAVRVAALDTVVRTDTVIVTADSSRRVRFAVRRQPYTVIGEIGARSSGADSVLLHIELDSIPIQLRLACQRAKGTGVQRALVVATAPRWARVVIGPVEQSAAVCNPWIVRPSMARRVAGLLRRVGVSAGVGIVVERGGQVVARPAVMIGVRVWP